MAYNPKTGKGLGRFYSAEHRAFRAREWRGFRDTFYDFFRWLDVYKRQVWNSRTDTYRT